MSVNLDILRAINGLSGDPFWDAFFIAFAAFGDFLIRTFSAAPFAFFKRWRKTALIWIIASCVSEFLNSKIKSYFMVTRPFLAYDWVNLVGGPAHESSFPSGHAMCMVACVAAAIPAILQSARNKKFAIAVSVLLAFMAGLMCFDRMYLGVHYPSDVFVGSILGAPLGFAIWKFSERTIMENPIDILKFKPKAGGAKTAKLKAPAPSLTKEKMAAAAGEWISKCRKALKVAILYVALVLSGIFACEFFVKRASTGSLVTSWTNYILKAIDSRASAEALSYVALVFVGALLLYVTVFWLLNAIKSAMIFGRRKEAQVMRCSIMGADFSTLETQNAFLAMKRDFEQNEF